MKSSQITKDKIPSLETGNDTCRYSTIDMSPGFDYYIHNCKGPSIPTSVLRKGSDNTIVAVLESNQSKKLIHFMKQKLFSSLK